MVEHQREREEEDKRQAEELKVLMEKEERRRGEKEVSSEGLNVMFLLLTTDGADVPAAVGAEP